jgi:hypothetical protein
MWYIYTMQYYYSSIKKNEILSLAGKCIELEIIKLSKVIQVQKEKGHVLYVEARPQR